MQYTDLTVDTGELCDGYTAPEEVRSRAQDAWYRLFVTSGLAALAGELGKDHEQDDGRYVLGWIVGEDEHYYYVIFDPSSEKVVTEKRHKAKRDGAS